MKRRHSIRWQLQCWHGLLLALVLAGFGVAVWQLARVAQWQQVDAELEQRARILETAMLRGTGTPAQLPPPPTNLPLTAREVSLFEGVPGRAYYFVLWRHDHQELARSAAAPPAIPRPERAAESSSWRWRGSFREHFDFAPRGECILVGRNLRGEFASRQYFGWLLAGSGIAVLALGLAVGGWISARALRPIEAISATASQIANGDLTQRIRSPASANELGQLVGVLNATFARLDAAFTRQARFTADAAHELRTPITVILTHSQNGLASECLNEEHRAAFAASQRGAQRMRRLTESLLTLARLDTAAPAAGRKRCDLSQITQEAVEGLRPPALAQEIDLALELLPAPCEGNPEQLGQVVSNLVSNALYYNRPGGRVRVKVAVEPGWAVLAVSDTGLGISPTDLPHIFERFYRVDKARSNSAGHTGLGLAIVQAIVALHGGTVAVASELGHGSNFTVRLPAASPPR